MNKKNLTYTKQPKIRFISSVLKNFKKNYMVKFTKKIFLLKKICFNLCKHQLKNLNFKLFIFIFYIILCLELIYF